jgi:hypothetical protein
VSVGRALLIAVVGMAGFGCALVISLDRGTHASDSPSVAHAPRIVGLDSAAPLPALRHQPRQGSKRVESATEVNTSSVSPSTGTTDTSSSVRKPTNTTRTTTQPKRSKPRPLPIEDDS